MVQLRSTGLAPATLSALRTLVLDTVASNHSRRVYAAALEQFLAWYGSEPRGPLNKALLHRYRAALDAQGLGAVSINHRLTALRKLAAEAADNGLLDPQVAAGIARVKGLRPPGRRLGNWLSRPQAEQLLHWPDTHTLQGKRDQALLAVLIGCGLRRSEAALLRCEQIQLREGRWVIVDLVGKGQRLRSVAMPSWCQAALDSWTRAAAVTAGRLFRPIDKAGRVAGPGMSAHAVYAVVRRYTQQLGWNLAPHALRRTHAKLAFGGGARLEQIQLSLGHVSVRTTERYLGVEQDWADAPCDHLGLRISPTE